MDRRDVGRYLRGEMARYPATPLGYFDSKTEQRLAAFGEKAAGARDPALLEEFPGSGMLRPRSVRRLTTSGVNSILSGRLPVESATRVLFVVAPMAA